MMKNKNYTTLLTALALMLMLGVGTAYGQTLVNQSSGTITNAGNIKFLNNDGVFQNDASHANDYTVSQTTSGTITFAGIPAGAVLTGTNTLGNTAVNRVPGWVTYSGVGNMTIYGTGGNTYYTNLTLEGGTPGSHVKTYLNITPGTPLQTHVSEIYFASGADRDYLICNDHEFYYDGTNQIIFPESNLTGGYNLYSELHLTVDPLLGTSGNKTVQNSATVGLKYGLFSDASATLTVLGNMTIGTIGSCDNGLISGEVVINGSITTKEQENTFDGDITINNGGDFTVDGGGNQNLDGDVDIATGGSLTSTNDHGDINIGGNLDIDDGGLLTIGENNNLNITGTITNNDNNCDNLTFDNGSTVSYLTPGAAVLATIPGGQTSNKHDYANLVITGGGTATVQSACSNTVYVREDFTLGTSGTPTNFNVVNAAIIMTGGDATYEGQSEVIGEFGRFAYGLVNGTEYVFNNAETKITFANNISGQTDNDYFSLNIRPNIDYTSSPRLNIVDPAPEDITDVHRKITPYATKDGFKASNLQLAFLPSEYGGYGPPQNKENRLRMVEGYNTTERGDKVVTGYSFNKNVDQTGWDWVSIQGSDDAGNFKYLVSFDHLAANNPGTTNQINYNGSDIILTDEIMPLISVVNGRWTNPGTWDEGRRPNSQDIVEIRHVVWTGNDLALFGGGAYTIEENDPSADLQGAGTIEFLDSPTNKIPILATSVTIAPFSQTLYDAGKLGNDRALFIDNADVHQDGSGTGLTGATLVFGNATFDPNNHGMFNKNAVPNSWAGNRANPAGMQGIYVTAPGPITPIIRGTLIDNQGAITNNSIIEVGK